MGQFEPEINTHSINPSAADLSGKHRAKSVPPKPNRLMADVDATFVQKIFHISQRERKPHIHHNSQADDLRARLEVADGAVFCHPQKLSARPACLNRLCSDSARLTAPSQGHQSATGAICFGPLRFMVRLKCLECLYIVMFE